MFDATNRAAVLAILAVRFGKRSHRRSKLRTSLAAAFAAAERTAEFDDLLQAISSGTPPDDATLAFAAAVLRELPVEIVAW